MSEANEQTTLHEHAADVEQQDKPRPGRSLAEWVSFGIATTVLLVVVGLILFYWFAVPHGPPILRVLPTDTIRKIDAQFYVPFTVGNSGGRTAAAVRVIAQLGVGGKVVERAEQQFNYLARGETQQGGFVFHHNPVDGRLRMQIMSYKQP